MNVRHPRSEHPIVCICCMWKSKLTAQDHRSSDITEWIICHFWYIHQHHMQEGPLGSPNTLPLLPGCRSKLHRYILNPPPGKKKCYYTPIPYPEKKSYHHSLSFTHNNDGETSAKQRETLFWRACLFSALRFSINNHFSSAVSQIKASRLLSYPTQLWGEEASVARQNS